MPPAIPHLYACILAGGSGQRFWPLSRKAKPKQFLALATDRPMLVETAARLEGLWLVKQPETAIFAGSARPFWMSRSTPEMTSRPGPAPACGRSPNGATTPAV